MRWTSQNDLVVLEFTPPDKVQPYLDGISMALSPLGFDASTPGGGERLLAWCEARVTRVLFEGELVEGEGVLDEVLSLRELAAFAAHVVKSSGYDEAFVAEARRYLDVVATGGCECKVCTKVDLDDPRGCRYIDIAVDVRIAVGAWLPLRDVVAYDMPVWAYQLSAQWAEASAQAKRAAREEYEAARAAQEKKNAAHLHGLKRLGLA